MNYFKIRTIKNKLKVIYASYFWKYKEDKISKVQLNQEYENGTWDYLSGISELSRFSVVAGYCHFFKDNPTILEVGCGAGTLCNRLNAEKYQKFVGIDIAEAAIKKAQNAHNSKSSFICSDAWDFETDDKFDIIIFNECLYYISDPDGLIKKYKAALNPDGFFIASIHSDYKLSTHIGKLIELNYNVLSTTIVKNELGQEWRIRVFKTK